MTLDDCVQLHERIEVTNIVGRYLARLVIRDGSKPVVEATGLTILQAVQNLNDKCWRISSLEELRSM